MSGSYQPLKFDVRATPVPLQWRGVEWEYRHGYGMGLERDGVYNPVSHRAAKAAREADLPNPRDAWFDGYAAGKAQRKRDAAGGVKAEDLIAAGRGSARGVICFCGRSGYSPKCPTHGGQKESP